jgi:DNA anti-recombination protein RmuC
MSSKSTQTVIIAIAGIIALLFLKLMFDMNRSMSQMTDHVGAISRDVGELQGDVHSMNESMQRMEQSVHGLGQAFSQGSQQLQQMNPAGMMQKMIPGGEQHTR